MTKKTPITAAGAPLPESIPVSQRVLPGEVVYPFFTWLGDRRAGRRDATQLQAMLEKNTELGVTPWLKGLRSGFQTACARDRRDTIALQAPLRDEAAKAIARYKALSGKADALQAGVEEARDVTIDATPTTAGEVQERPEQIQRRRQKERDARLAQARAAAEQAAGECEAILARIAQLKEAFDFHEDVYTYRLEALRNYYSKRQAVYLRRGLHKLVNDGQAPVGPEVTIPQWPATAFPSLAEDQAEVRP